MTKWPQPLLAAFRSAEHIVALTGAGISAESGIPTFRDAQTGLWAKFRPEELATPEAFARNPGRVWAWYMWRRSFIEQAKPNPAHKALAAMERLAPKFTLLTQNIDGLHQMAGSQQVIELHGNIRRTICAENRHAVEKWEPVPEGEAPRCPICGSPLRPDVVWFGEALPADALEAAYAASRNADVMLVVGTSAMVQPTAMLPVLAAEHGAYLVEINPQETALTEFMDAVLKGPAGKILPELVRAVWGEEIRDA